MYKVMIADDDELFRNNLKSMIDWSAYDLTVAGEAANGREALELIGNLSPEIILCDIKMPVMDGLTVLKHISNKTTAKFIILSGYNDFEFTKQAIMYGAFDYALKPVQQEELSGILMRAVDALNKSKDKQKEDLLLYIDLRKIMVDKYESLLIHFVESRDITSLCEYIDNFYMELAPASSPDILKSSYTEFVVLADKACTMFKLDSAQILDKFKLNPSSAVEKDALLYVAGAVKKIFTEIVTQLISAKNSQCKVLVDEVVDYLEKNYHEKISLESIAKRYFINPSYFSQIFKSRTRVSFSNYLINLRIEKAKELLRLDKFKVYQIAEMVGYEAEKHFCQLFKKYTGLSPTEYAKEKEQSP